MVLQECVLHVLNYMVFIVANQHCDIMRKYKTLFKLNSKLLNKRGANLVQTMQQSSQETLNKIIQKLGSQSKPTKERAIFSLHTKINSNIITLDQLAQCKALPGVLMTWINDNQGTKSEYLLKVLTILHKYTFTESGLILLKDYEATQFLQQFRKYLVSKWTNVQKVQTDLITKIIKCLLPLNQQSYQKYNKTKQSNSQNINQVQSNREPIQQNVKTSEEQSHSKILKKNKKKNTQNILQFKVSSEPLPKAIDDELYSLLIQLKHGKKQTTLQTLIKIEQIYHFWNGFYFKYCEELVKQLTVVIQGKVCSSMACKLLYRIINSFVEKQNQNSANIQGLNQLINFSQPVLFKEKLIQVNLQVSTIIFQNPFSYEIFQIFKHERLLSNVLFEYFLSVRYAFGGVWIVHLLKRILKNRQKLSNIIQQNQDSLCELIDYHCKLSSSICQQSLILLSQLFSAQKLQALKKKVPSLQFYMRNQSLAQSFHHLQIYVPKNQEDSFDFNIELHNLKQHIINLENGIPSIAQNLKIISVYLDCMLFLAMAVATEDHRFYNFYPTIKQMLIKISNNKYIEVRKQLYDCLLMIYNSSQKISYLNKTSLKSDILKLIFTDGQFYIQLFKNSLNQTQTLISFLQFTKSLQLSLKDQNKKYLNNLSQIYFILTHMKNEGVAERAKIIIQRLKNKKKTVNILLSLFNKNKQERLQVNKSILQIEQDFVEIISLQQQKHKKNLIYEQGTIQNYLNYILNETIEEDVKRSALQQLKQCSKRAQLSMNIVNKLLQVHQAMQRMIKRSMQGGQDINFCLASQIHIYCILERKLRTHFKQSGIRFQSKVLMPQLYLNMLIKLCSCQIVNKEVVAELVKVIYLHSFTTYTSALLGDQNLIVNWTCNIFPHLELIKLQTSSPNIAQKCQFYNQNQQQTTKRQTIQDIISKWLKSYQMKLTNPNKIVGLYLQAALLATTTFSERIANQPDIINELQSSLARHMHHMQYEQLSILCCVLQKMPKKCLIGLQQIIIPTIYNQLLKNQASHFHMILIKIGNIIGWKRNKQLNSVIVSIQHQRSYLLKMLIVLPRLAQEQLKLIIKSTLDNVNFRNFQSISTLYFILIDHLNKFPQIFQSFDQYTQMLIINTLLKTIKSSHQKLTNLSAILLDRILIVSQNSNSLTKAMGVTSNLISIIVEHDKISCQSFLFVIQTIKASILNSLSNKDGLQNIDWNHEVKMTRILLSKFADLISKYSINLPATIVISIYDFINALLNCQQISLKKAAYQIQLIDFSVLLFSKLVKKQLVENKKIENQQALNLVILQTSKVFEHVYFNLVMDKDLLNYVLSSTNLLQNTIIFMIHLNQNVQAKNCCKNLLRSNLDNIGRVIHYLALNLEDQFVFKLNQHLPKNVNLFQFLTDYIEQGGESYLKMFMTICSVWKKNNKIFNQSLFVEQEEADSFTLKIYNIVNWALQKGFIHHCKSLLALSVSAKKNLFCNPKFLQNIKRWRSLVDTNLMIESSSNKNVKKSQQNSTLSLSRRSAICNEDNQPDSNKLADLCNIIEFLSAVFQDVRIQGSDLKDKVIQNVPKQSFKAMFGLVQGFFCLCKIYGPNSQLTKKFYKMLAFLSQCQILYIPLGCHFSQSSSSMLQQTTKNILQDTMSQGIIKQDLQTLQILLAHKQVRSYLYKTKVLQQLNSKIIKYQQKNQVPLGLIYDIVGIHLSLSAHNDDNYANLMNNNGKKFLQILITQVILQKSVNLSQRILKFVSNFAAYKGNKNILMHMRELHKAILGQIQCPQIEYKDILITLMYNLLYKNSKGIELYRRPDVIQTLKQIELPNCQSQSETKQIYSALMQILQSDQSLACFQK